MNPRTFFDPPKIHTMPAADTSTQRPKALASLDRRGRGLQSSVRYWLVTTVSRMEQVCEVVRFARG